VNQPLKIGRITGKKRGISMATWEVRWESNNSIEWIAELYLKPHVDDNLSPTEQLRAGKTAAPHELRRRLIVEKLSGSLTEFVYSMDSAEIEFMPYQFKPVLKFIESPTDRLLIADEVGLGKTIEAALVWQELQARRDARRLIVFCPKMIAESWKTELVTKFGISAEICNAAMLESHLKFLEQLGPSHRFAVIATYTSVRGSRDDFKGVETGLGGRSEMGRLLKALTDWSESYSFADLVIFDEAHILRNPGSLASRTAKVLANACGGVLCVSATPINNGAGDLRTLLSFLDPGSFEDSDSFKRQLEANRPAVIMGNALAQVPPDYRTAKGQLEALKSSSFVSESDLIPLVERNMSIAELGNGDALIETQRLAEKLNLLSRFVTRTRRRQVHEMRAVRFPMVIPVDFKPREREFYDKVCEYVRLRVEAKRSDFSILHLITPQLRMASCIPAMVRSYREGRQGEVEDVIGGLYEDDDGRDDGTEEADKALDRLLQSFEGHDFDAEDTKYNSLRSILSDKDKLGADRKIIIFAYFRGTLEYLARRLRTDGQSVSLLHGGMNQVDRLESLREFEDEQGSRILLSSEVGSEGLNLQFARVVINYDLPWNPMRVEQRIGRIDRVGQKAEKLTIVHFKTPGTIEERLYELLHEKLEAFRNSIGDFEDILGEQVNDMARELFSAKLDDRERARLIEAKANVLLNKAALQQSLEQSAASLIGLSDFVRAQIDRSRKLGRFVSPEELRRFAIDFFTEKEMGCVLQWDAEIEGAFTLNLSTKAADKLQTYAVQEMQGNHGGQLGPTIRGTFDPTVARQRVNGRKVALINHLSPLLRWMTSEARSKEKCQAALCRVSLPSEFPKGRLVFAVQKWTFSGLKGREALRYALVHVESAKVLGEEQSEEGFGRALSAATSVAPRPADDQEMDCVDMAFDALQERFEAAHNLFVAENQSTALMQRRQIQEHFSRRISDAGQRLNTAQVGGKTRVVPMFKAILDKLERQRDFRLGQIEESGEKAKGGGSQVDVAIGILIND
jgi:superfamily II DNA or RNA helicase